jgi:hypothetical protein
LRKRLPDRRPNITLDIDWQGHPVTLTVGLCPATGLPREVFGNTAKGGHIAVTVADACVWASMLLQSGCAPAALGKSLGREAAPAWAGAQDAPASVLGAIADALAGLDIGGAA